jgi:PKD repeat protein
VSPWFAYRHPAGSGASITGGVILPGTAYPAAYRGSYFYGDYVRNFIRRLVLDASGSVLSDQEFHPTAPNPVDISASPSGELHYLSITRGTLYRIRSTVPNLVPVAQSSATPLAGPPPLTVQFSSAGSGDPDGDTISFAWSFGDGATSTAPNPSHTYATAGTYTVTLTVSDGRGGVTAAAPLTLRVANMPPVVAITAPAAGSLYRAGDTISFAGTATDPEDGALTGTRLVWTVLFHNGQQSQPFQSGVTGESGSFVIPRTGEPSADTWFELVLEATDSGGAKAVARAAIRPRTVRLTVSTVPAAGHTVTVNGATFPSPFTFTSVVGFEHTIRCPSPQRRIGPTRYLYFDSWSDEGAREHTIRAPDEDTTYLAQLRSTMRRTLR